MAVPLKIEYTLCMQLTNILNHSNNIQITTQKWIAFLTVVLYSAFLIYASTIPFDQYQYPAKNFPQELLYGWKNDIHLFDVVQNVVAYIPYGFLLYVFFRIRITSILGCVSLSLLIGGTFALSMEVIQSFNQVRASSLLDAMLNTLGTSIGCLGGILFMLTIKFWQEQFQKTFFIYPRCPLLSWLACIGLLAWGAYHLHPFTPTFDPGHIKTAIKPIFQLLHDLDRFDDGYYFKYITHGALVFIGSLFFIKPNRRLLVLLFFTGTICALKITVMTRFIAIESVLGLITAIMVLELLVRISEKKTTV